MGEGLFELQSVILCDDIRREDNGKAFIIGVYSGDIVVQSPANLGLSLWLQGRALKGATSIAAQLKFAGEKDLASESSVPVDSLKLEPGDDFIFAIGRIPINLHSNGYLTVQLKFGDSEWSEIIKKKVIISADVASIGKTPPS